MAAGYAVFLDKVQLYAVRCQIYEDPSARAAALKTVNFSKIEENALLDLARKGKLGLAQDELERTKLHELCLWFKNSFKWVNQPSCETCGGDSLSVGAGIPNYEELKWLAERVELYRCKMCFSEVHFPPYNDLRKLPETRRGRCEEWANCFTLYCRALGYRAILDFIVGQSNRVYLGFLMVLGWGTFWTFRSHITLVSCVHGVLGNVRNGVRTFLEIAAIGSGHLINDIC
ncbi:unnamed protein product [Calypogeia fissa]